MRARTLILVFLAIILAGGTAFLARNFLARERETIVQEQAPLKVQAPAKSVLVAKVDLKRGQILRPEDTVWQIWPEGGLDRNYIVLGGPPVPARTPESFAGYVVRNPITGQGSKDPKLDEWSTDDLGRLPGLKFQRTLWVCDIAGGPQHYAATNPGSTPLGLEEAHRELKISPAEFDEVAAELGRTLDFFKVPEREKEEVLAAFAAHKGEVTEGYSQ